MKKNIFTLILSALSISIFTTFSLQAAPLSLGQVEAGLQSKPAAKIIQVHDTYYHSHRHHHHRYVSCRTRHKQCIRRYGYSWRRYKRCMRKYRCRPRSWRHHHHRHHHHGHRHW